MLRRESVKVNQDSYQVQGQVLALREEGVKMGDPGTETA